MNNLPESAVYEAGIYQLETTDPVVGGPNGVSNLQARQLANRTNWLKVIGDEVIASRGGQPNVGARLGNIEKDVQGLNPDMQNMVAAVIMQALDLAGLANREIIKTLTQRFQTGEITIFNRGIINGCVVTRSSNATRNLNISAGSIFMHGHILPSPEQLNSAVVPANNSTSPSFCYSYIWIDGNGVIQHDCTALQQNVPKGGLPLYYIAIPAGNNEATDPFCANCTLTDVRRIESGYPGIFLNAPFAYVALPYDMLGADYTIDLDILSFEGSGFQMGYVYTSDRLKNGFKICLNGTADTIIVRWTAKKLIL